jgi:hypothetical protein
VRIATLLYGRARIDPVVLAAFGTIGEVVAESLFGE